MFRPPLVICDACSSQVGTDAVDMSGLRFTGEALPQVLNVREFIPPSSFVEPCSYQPLRLGMQNLNGASKPGTLA